MQTRLPPGCEAIIDRPDFTVENVTNNIGNEPLLKLRPAKSIYFGINSILFQACLIRNSLPYSIKNCGSLLESKAKFKEQVLHKIFSQVSTVISPYILIWKFCGKAQFPQNFERFAQNYEEIVSFHKNSSPEN